MSQIPSDPSNNNRRRRPVTYDELLAMFVAFLTLGSVLFWGLTRSGVSLFGDANPLSTNGTPDLIGDLNDELIIGVNPDSDDGQVGFDTPGALGAAAGAGSILGDIDSSEAKVPAPRAQANNQATVSQPEKPAASIPKPAPPELPKQDAQPAAPETPATPIAPPLEVTQEALEFKDVPDDYWAKPYIDALSERDVFDGNIVDGVAEGDTFNPEDPISRAQLARAITKAFPLSEEEAAISFSDVDSDFWALEFINEAVKGSYMNGFPDGSFKPELPVPRAQALTAMVTGSNATAQGEAADVVQRYSDADDIQDWAVPKVAAATQAGLVVNHPDLTVLNPNQPATRAEVAAMIYQTLVAQGRIDPIDGEYVVQP
ncbi:MAG: S-layer homology domain-containing protein [Leptolyngbyaceae cyanobacterium MAG.088]|nr:S-layer homology domain-containing protein [Leptolyngbyaceae cyanobacterium MAG.088]